LIAYFHSNISVEYYENPTMLSRVIAKTSGTFFETQCTWIQLLTQASLQWVPVTTELKSTLRYP